MVFIYATNICFRCSNVYMCHNQQGLLFVLLLLCVAVENKGESKWCMYCSTDTLQAPQVTVLIIDFNCRLLSGGKYLVRLNA